MVNMLRPNISSSTSRYQVERSTISLLSNGRVEVNCLVLADSSIFGISLNRRSIMTYDSRGSSEMTTSTEKNDLANLVHQRRVQRFQYSLEARYPVAR